MLANASIIKSSQATIRTSQIPSVETQDKTDIPEKELKELKEPTINSMKSNGYLSVPEWLLAGKVTYRKLTQAQADSFLREVKELNDFLPTSIEFHYDKKNEEKLVEQAKEKEFKYFSSDDVRDLIRERMLFHLAGDLRYSSASKIADLIKARDSQPGGILLRYKIKGREKDLIYGMASQEMDANNSSSVKDRKAYVEFGEKYLGLTNAQVNAEIDYAIKVVQARRSIPKQYFGALFGPSIKREVAKQKPFVIVLTPETRQRLKIDREVLDDLRKELGSLCNITKADARAKKLKEEGKLSEEAYLRFKEEFEYVRQALSPIDFHRDKKNADNLAKEAKGFLFCTESDIKTFARNFLLNHIRTGIACGYSAQGQAGYLIIEHNLQDDPEVKKAIKGNEASTIYRMALSELEKDAGVTWEGSVRTKVNNRKIYIEAGKKLGLTKAEVDTQIDAAQAIKARMRFPIGGVGNFLNKLF